MAIVRASQFGESDEIEWANQPAADGVSRSLLDKAGGFGDKSRA